MENGITKSASSMNLSPDTLASVVLNGDVSKLNPKDKVNYYIELCKRVGIDPATQPFKLLRLNGKEVFYADKSATQQLSQKHNISHEIVKREQVKDVYVVTVRARLADGRYTDEDGAVTVGSATGETLANALMKATTKAKRRAVLALLGLGMMDESEIDTIPNAQRVELPTNEVPSVQDAVVVEKKPVDDDTVLKEKAIKAIENAKDIKALDKIETQAHKYHQEGRITTKTYDEIGVELTKRQFELSPKGE